MGVSRSHVLDSALVAEQIRAVLGDIPPAAVKTGALGSSAIVEAVADALVAFCRSRPLVIDPVMLSSSGSPLLDPSAESALRRLLFPVAALVTPNLDEAERLTSHSVRNLAEMREAARFIADLGPRAVLIKGGHLASGDAVDLLLSGGVFREFTGPRLDTRHTHGTGCTFSAAITALLARGEGLEAAVAGAKAFIVEAIRTAPGLGAGNGPLNHWG
jgi:hydroxymethylpyrimidine/phosphomethylpyrimidine kinase